MTITAGNFETVTLDVNPADTDTAVTLIVYSPAGLIVPATEDPEIALGTGALAGTAIVTAVIEYDEPGVWVQVWHVTGTGAGVSTRSVYVDPIAAAPDMTWPPTLAQVKADLGIEPDDTAQDLVVARQLAASIAFVERVKADTFNFADESGLDLEDPDADLILGTIRLAGRWNARRRSVDGLVNMGDMGAGRVPSFDPDIDRLLRIGRFQGPVMA